MIEMLGAAVVMGILLTSVLTTFSSLQQMRRRVAQESRCLIVMQNVVTRLAATDQPTTAQAQALLERELAAAALSDAAALKATCRELAGQCELTIWRNHEQAVVTVRVPLAPAHHD